MAFKTYDEAAVALRRYLNDVPQLNKLTKDFESTDDELIDYIKDTINNINLNYEPKSNYTFADIIVNPGDAGYLPWSIIKLGATLELLQTKGIISARNTLTYSDSGGVTVQEFDLYGRYMSLFNMLVTKYERGVAAIKLRNNIDNCYGGTNSPFATDQYYA